MCIGPNPYPREFRDDVVNVVRNREPEQTVKQIAGDFGIAESCLRRWMHQADVEDGNRPGVSDADRSELRAAKKRIRLLEAENEVLRRATAYLSQANLPGK
jgi:transposase-like protein